MAGETRDLSMKLDFGPYEQKRQVVGYHGCLSPEFHSVFQDYCHLPMSVEEHDWLGQGVYVWEYGPQRAQDWALAKSQRAKKRAKEMDSSQDAQHDEPYVVGVMLELGQCLDLLDTRWTNELAEFYADMEDVFSEVKPNEGGYPGDPIAVKRYLDCAVLEAFIAFKAEGDKPFYFQTVRGCFWEGGEVFTGSAIQKQSHVQIAIRDYSCVLGYFVPGQSCEPPKPKKEV